MEQVCLLPVVLNYRVHSLFSCVPLYIPTPMALSALFSCLGLTTVQCLDGALHVQPQGTSASCLTLTLISQDLDVWSIFGLSVEKGLASLLDKADRLLQD